MLKVCKWKPGTRWKCGLELGSPATAPPPRARVLSPGGGGDPVLLPVVCQVQLPEKQGLMQSCVQPVS